MNRLISNLFASKKEVIPGCGISYFVDESEKSRGKEKFSALIAIKTNRPEDFRQAVREVISPVVASKVLREHKSITKDWIPHYCEDFPFEVHQRVLEAIAQMPFAAYVAYARRDWIDLVERPAPYSWYNYLFRQIFSFRLLADRRKEIDQIVYEQHASKKESRRRELASELGSLPFRRGKEIPLISAGKSELALSVCDYVGGAFMSFLCEEDPKVKSGQMRRKFGFIAEKVRWIKNCETGEIFTSKSPFVGG